MALSKRYSRRLFHQEIWSLVIKCPFRTRSNNFAWAPTILHECAKSKMHQHQFRLPRAFRMTMRNFHMVMQNQLWAVPLIYNKKCLLVHFAWLCEIFSWLCEMEIHNFSTPFWHFFHFFLLNPPQPPLNQLQSLVQVHFFFLIIHIICPSQFHFSFVIQCFKNHFKTSPKPHKNQ